LTDYKEVIGWILGASIAVVWISFALLGPGNMLFLVVAISLTILLGTLSGGFIALGTNKSELKEVIGWMAGAGIAVAWIYYALLDPGSMVLLVIAISLSILLGTISGGLIALSKKNKEIK
jgi:membrane protease YdiL (CAAX protease family)